MARRQTVPNQNHQPPFCIKDSPMDIVGGAPQGFATGQYKTVNLSLSSWIAKGKSC
jgi:hypothetical protein